MTRDPRMQQDPLGFLSGIPAWAKQNLFDPLGQAVAGAITDPNTKQLRPGVEGALNTASWLDDVFLKTPVGAAALLSGPDEVRDAFANSPLPLWERPKAVGHAFLGGMQQIAEDPNEPLWARGLATGVRAANLRGEMLAPLSPGSGAIRGGIKGGFRGAGETLVNEAKQGTVFGQRVGSKREGVKEFAKDFAVPGRPEVRAVTQIFDALGRAIEDHQSKRAIQRQGFIDENGLPRPDEPMVDMNADVNNPGEDPPFNVIHQFIKAEDMVESMPKPERIAAAKRIEELQVRMYGKAVADMTLAEMWARNGVSYQDARDALDQGQMAGGSSYPSGVPGLSITGGNGNYSLTYRDQYGRGVANASMHAVDPAVSARRMSGRRFGNEPPVGGAPYGQKVETMYLDRGNKESTRAIREIMAALEGMDAFTGSTLSYWSATLLHKASVQRRLAMGGTIPDAVRNEIDPLTVKAGPDGQPDWSTGQRLYADSQIRIWGQGKDIAGERTGIRVQTGPYVPRSPNMYDRGREVQGQHLAHYDLVVEVAKRHGLKGQVVEIRRVGVENIERNPLTEPRPAANGWEFVLAERDTEKIRRVAAELGHRFDSQTVEVYHYGAGDKAGTPVGEARFHMQHGANQQLIDTLKEMGNKVSSKFRVETSFDQGDSFSGLTLRMEEVDADKFALFMSRINDRLTSEGDQYSATGLNVRTGRMERLDVDAQEALVSRGTGTNAERPTQAGGTGEGAEALGPRGSARVLDSVGFSDRPQPTTNRTIPDLKADFTTMRPKDEGGYQLSRGLSHNYDQYDSTRYDDPYNDGPDAGSEPEPGDEDFDYDRLPPGSSGTDYDDDIISTPIHTHVGEAVSDDMATRVRLNDAQVYDIVEDTDPLATTLRVEDASGNGRYVQVDDIIEVYADTGDVLYRRAGRDAGPPPEFATDFTLPSEQVPLHMNVTNGLNDPAAVRVRDYDGRTYELPPNLSRPLSQGGIHLRVLNENGHSTRILRDNITEVYNDIGDVLYSRGRNIEAERMATENAGPSIDHMAGLDNLDNPAALPRPSTETEMAVLNALQSPEARYFDNQVRYGRVVNHLDGLATMTGISGVPRIIAYTDGGQGRHMLDGIAHVYDGEGRVIYANPSNGREIGPARPSTFIAPRTSPADESIARARSRPPRQPQPEPDRVGQVTTQQMMEARDEVVQVLDQSRSTPGLLVVTTSGRHYPLGPDSIVHGPDLVTGGERIPLATLSHIARHSGEDVSQSWWNFRDANTVLGSLLRFVGQETGSKQIVPDFIINMFDRLRGGTRAADEAPFEQTFPGPPDDNVTEYVPTATQGSRTVGENSETALTGGGPAPEPMVAAPEGPISPGNLAEGRPPQLGPGIPVPHHFDPVQDSSADKLRIRMGTTDPTPKPTMLEVWTRAQEGQYTKMKAIVKKVVDRRAITGKEASELVKGLERAVEDGVGDVTAEEVARISKSLDPVIQAQAMYDSTKDVNDQLHKIATNLLRQAEKERDRALAKVIGIDRKIFGDGNKSRGLMGQMADVDERSAERLAKIQKAHDERIARINESVEVALDKMATGEADAIVKAISDVDAAVARAELVEASRVHLTQAQAEKLAKRGYLSPKESEVFQKYNFNTGMYHPVVARFMAKAILANPTKWQHMMDNKPITTAESLRSAARYIGSKPKELQAEMAARGLQDGDLTAFMLGIRLVAVDETRKMQALVKSGASKEEIAAAYSDYQEFLLHVGGAQSELGRALVSLRTSMSKKLLDAFKVRDARGMARWRKDQLAKELDDAGLRVAAIQNKYDDMLAALGERQTKALDAANTKLLKDTEEALESAKKQKAKLQAKIEEFQKAEIEAARHLNEAIDEVRTTAMQKMAADNATIDDLKAIMEQGGDDLDRIALAVRNLHTITSGDKLVVYMTNNLYSGIGAQEANALGSMFRILGYLGETYAAEQAGKFWTSMGGKSAITQGETSRAIGGMKSAFAPSESGETLKQKWDTFRGVKRKEGEDAAVIVSATRGIPKAFEAWVDVMLKGHSAIGARAQDLPRPAVWGQGEAGLAFELFNRLNGSFDAAARLILGNAEQQALYWKHARQSLVKELTEKGTPINASTLTEEMLIDRFDYMMINPAEGPDSAFIQATRLKETSTYSGRLNPLVENVLHALGTRIDMPGLGETPIFRAIFGATRFTWGAMVYSLETTPIGIIKAANRLRQSRAAGVAGEGVDAEAMAREAARMGVRSVAGSAAMGWGMQMYASGALIGKDREGRGRDDSIQIAGSHIPLRMGWPMTAPLIYVARMMDKIDDGRLEEKQWPEVMLDVSLGFGEALANQPVLRGSADIMNALRFGDASAARLAARYTSRLVPYSSFMRDVAQMIDNIDRDPRSSLVDMWKENIPLLSTMVPEKVNRYGEPVINKPEGVTELLPFWSAERAANPADPHITRLQRTIDPVTKKPLLGGLEAPERTLAGIKLESDEHARWQTIAGTERKGALVDLVASSRFLNADPAKQAELINEADNKARAKAKKVFAEELLRSPNSDDQIKGVRIGISATKSRFDRLKLVGKILPTLDKNPDMARAFDKFKEPGDLTLAQYRQGVRLIPLIENQPEFSNFNGTPIGNEKVWEQYHDELRQYNQYLKDGRQREAQIFLSRHTVLRRYRALAQRPGGKNAVITRMKQKYPILKYFVLPDRDDGQEDAPLVINPRAKVGV